MMGLPYGEEIIIVDRIVWTQSTSVTDRQTDGQNYDHKDRAIALRGKNVVKTNLTLKALLTSPCLNHFESVAILHRFRDVITWQQMTLNWHSVEIHMCFLVLQEQRKTARCFRFGTRCGWHRSPFSTHFAMRTFTSMVSYSSSTWPASEQNTCLECPRMTCEDGTATGRWVVFMYHGFPPSTCRHRMSRPIMGNC